MVNKTQFYKTKVALAVVLSLGLTACGGDDSTSNTAATQGVVANQNQLTGTVQGVVVDSNGDAIADVAVYLGEAETVTNLGGQYVFTNVAVTNVAGVNNEGNETDDRIGQPLVITIGGTAEYLGALVTVTPEAMVNNTGGQGEDQNGGNSDVTSQTFVDGFTARAAIAVLPMLNAGAYGYIRDCRTGQPLVDTADVLSLDFGSVSADVVVAEQLTNAEDTHTIGADAEGYFSLTNLAANSTYTITPKQGWEITASGGTSFTTNSEGSSEYLETIEVCPVEFEEADVTVAPFIKSIDGQIGTSTVDAVPSATDVEYAALNQGIVNDFVINFSEEMAATFDLNEARVKVIAPGETLSETVADATVTLSADGKSAMISFVTDLAEGSKVDVWFPHWTALDANDALFLAENESISYDNIEVALTGSEKAVYSHAYFCTFAKPSDIASVTLAPQIFNADTTEDGDSTNLSDYSLAFQDNVADDGAVITQLNDGDEDSFDRLEALATARGETVEIKQEYAVVEFDDSNSASILWELNGDAVTATGDFTIVENGTQKEAHFNGVEHEDVISATPVNGFGDVVTAGKVSLTLVDAIAPTTVLQESYNITVGTNRTDLVGGTTANASFGNGGEISAPGTTATAHGEPIIYIQPRHLDGAGDRNEEFNALTAGMSGRLTAAEVTALGGATAAQAAISVSTIASHNMPIYDATAAAAWADVPATIGVAFNEDVTLTSTAPAFSGSTTLSDFKALNDVTTDVDGNPAEVDLVTFKTPSVVGLSLDAGADLGFVGSVTDSRGNVSTANTQVFIQDAFPPMMTASVWNGITLDLTFNEPVVIPSNGTTITVIDPQTTVNDIDISVTTTNASVTGNVLSITLTTADNTAIAPLFVAGLSNEFLYDDDATSTDEETHALIDWDNIKDTTGNAWSEFNPSDRGMEAPANNSRRWEVVAPRFLAVNGVGAFTVTYAYAGLDSSPVGDADGFTASITFSHPLNFGSVTPAAQTQFVEKADGNNNDVFFENVADIQRLLVLDLNGNGVFDSVDAFPAGTSAAFVTSGGTTRLDLVVPSGMTITYGVSELVFASANVIVNDTTDLTTGDTFVTGNVVSTLTAQSRNVSDVINN